MLLENEKPIIRQTIFILNDMLSYKFDVNQTIELHLLKRMIAAAAHLQKNNFSLIHDNIDYTDQDDSRLMNLFPNMQEVIFYVQKGPVEELDYDTIMKIHMKSYCPLHEFKYLSYYCFNCNKSICSICITEKTHQYHKYKEKCDYLQSSKNLVDLAFKSNTTINMDPSNLKKSDKIVLLNEKLHKTYFGKLYEMLKEIENKFDEIINCYNKTNKSVVDNFQDNLILFKRFCVKGLDELKEEIGIQKIMIDEDVYLTFHNRFQDLTSHQVKFEQDLKKFNELNMILPGKIEELMDNYYLQIYKVLNELRMSNSYQGLINAIKEKDINAIEEQEVVEKIVGNAKSLFDKRKSLTPNNRSNSNSKIETDNSYLTTKLQTQGGPIPFSVTVNNGNTQGLDCSHEKIGMIIPIGTEDRWQQMAKNPFIPEIPLKQEAVREFKRTFLMSPIFDSQSLRIVKDQEEKPETLNLRFTSMMGVNGFLKNCAHTNLYEHIYITGGIDINQKQSKIVLKYDHNNNTLIRLLDMEKERAHHSMVSQGDFIYAIGGVGQNSCEKYSISLMKWIKMPNMNIKERRNAMLYIFNNYLYVFFGKDSNGYVDSIERINLRASNAVWERVYYTNPDYINLKCYGCGLYEVGNELFFFGGICEDKVSNRVMSFDFTTNAFSFNEQELEWNNYFIENKLEMLGRLYTQITAETYTPIFLELND